MVPKEVEGLAYRGYKLKKKTIKCEIAYCFFRRQKYSWWWVLGYNNNWTGIAVKVSKIKKKEEVDSESSDFWIVYLHGCWGLWFLPTSSFCPGLHPTSFLSQGLHRISISCNSPSINGVALGRTRAVREMAVVDTCFIFALVLALVFILLLERVSLLFSGELTSQNHYLHATFSVYFGYSNLFYVFLTTPLSY